MTHPIFPSILSTNFFDLEERLKQFAKNKIDFIHLDVMDGHLVSNLSFGPSMAKSIKSKFPFKIDAHLMVDPPQHMIQWFIDAGSDWISFHLEASGDVEKNIAAIKDRGCKAGLAINPDIEVEKLFPYLESVDFVLLMSVFAGYGGQKFMETTLQRVETVKNKIDELGTQCTIQVDGGLNADNIPTLREKGADHFVVGTYLFNSENVDGTVAKLVTDLN